MSVPPEPTADYPPDPPAATDSRAAVPAAAEPTVAGPFQSAQHGDPAATAAHEPNGRDPDRPPAPPGFAIERELGRGGMGVVYLARQLGLSRQVALKTVLRADASRVTVARFWAEAEVMAAVKHPNVVQVYELGEYDGRPFMAMEFVPGGSLADRLARGPLTPREAAGLVGQAAAGVGAAHELGVVHRDLKPGNVLLAADGAPKVTDFGLAKRRAADLTQTQAVLGTPAYMAPEQAAGRAKFVGPQADVWALGVILYECVSGRPPFEGATVADLLSQILSSEAAPLRAAGAGVPRDLGTIVAKCLAKEPEHRYAGALELAADLGRFLRGEPIAARPVGQFERLARWARRKPAAAAAYGFSSLTAVLAATVLVVAGFWRDAEGARRDAEGARDEAQRLREAADAGRREEARLRQVADAARAGEAAGRRQVERERDRVARYEYARTIQAAHAEWRENNVAAALAMLDATSPGLRGWEWHYVHRLCNGQRVTMRGRTSDRAAGLAFSPDGTKVLCAGSGMDVLVWDAGTGEQLFALQGHVFSARAAWTPDGRIRTADGEGTVRFWDARTGAKVATLEKRVTGEPSPDGTRVLSSDDRTAVIQNAQTGAVERTFGDDQTPVRSPRWSPDGAKVLTVSPDLSARVWDARTGEKVLDLKTSARDLRAAWWGPDGTRVLTASDDAAQVWDARTGKDLFALRGGAVAQPWSPDGAHVLTDDAGMARLWDAKTGDLRRTLPTAFGWPETVRWSPDGTRVVMCGTRTGPALTHGGRTQPRVWDTRTGYELTFSGHRGGTRAAVWSPDGTRLATSGTDGTVRVWDAGTAAEFRTIEGGAGEPAQAWNPDGRSFFVVGAGRLQVKDARTGAPRPPDVGKAGAVWSASWSRDGGRLFALGRDGNAYAWDAKTGTSHRLKLFTPERNQLPPVAEWSPDGSRIAVAIASPEVYLRDAGTGREQAVLRGHTDVVGSVRWSPDGSKVLTARGGDLASGWVTHAGGYHGEGAARVWDAETGAQLLALPGHETEVRIAEWSPDGSRVLTATQGAVRVWDASSGAELFRLKVSDDVACRVAAWSPDGSKVVTSWPPSGVRLWDARTGAEQATLGGHTAPVTAVAWDRDGTRLVTAALDGTGRLWDGVSGAELLVLREGGGGTPAWSPGGAELLTSQNGVVRIWDATPLDRAFVPKFAPPARK